MSASLRPLFEANLRLLNATGDIPFAMATAYLGVAVWRPEVSRVTLSMEELGARIGLPVTTMSGHMAYLSARHRKRPGLDLVQMFENPENRRRKTFHLTSAGEGLARQLEVILRTRL